MQLNSVVFLTATMLAACSAFGQNYPVKPIHVYAANESGGGSDIVIRAIQPSVMSSLGQPLVIENRNVVIAGEALAKGPADGYSVGVFGANLWLTPLLHPTTYDAVRDFAGVTMLTRQPGVLLVHPSLPVNSVRELIALAKARPGQLNYGSANTAGLAHLAYELFKSMAGVDIVRIAYKSTASSNIALISNEVQTTVGPSAVVAASIKSGKVRALAVTTAQRSPLLPDLPTVAESGFPGYESSSVFGMVTHTKTPAAIIRLLNEKIVAALNNPDIKAKFMANGLEVVGGTPQELDTFIKGEVGRMGKVIKDNNITAE